jgi:thiol-disulfide isomerase/thioredoxin
MSGVVVWSEGLQWILLLALSVMVGGLVYLVGQLYRRLGPDLGPLIPNDGLALKTVAPPLVAVETRTGKTVQLADHTGRTTVLAFLSPSCRPCAELVPHLNRLANARREVSFIVVAMNGQGYDYQRELSGHIQVVSDPEASLQKAYEVRRSPLIYVIDAEGKVAIRSVSNDLLDLEDTLAGLGRDQGKAPWMVIDTQGQAREDRHEGMPADADRT